MMTEKQALVAMRIAELNASAQSLRLARELRDAAEPTPRWSIIRLIRPHSPVAAA